MTVWWTLSANITKIRNRMEPAWCVKIKLDKSALDPAVAAIMPDFFNVSAPTDRVKIEPKSVSTPTNQTPSKK